MWNLSLKSAVEIRLTAADDFVGTEKCFVPAVLPVKQSLRRSPVADGRDVMAVGFQHDVPRGEAVEHPGQYDGRLVVEGPGQVVGFREVVHSLGVVALYRRVAVTG